MLSTLIPHLKSGGSKIALPKWDQQISFLKNQKEELRQRYLNHGTHDSNGFRILKKIIGLVDSNLEYLRRQEDDFDRWHNWFSSMKSVASTYFDPASTGRAYVNMFYKSSNPHTKEYICSVDDVNHLKILPLDTQWNMWLDIKPVHIWYHDTSEYSLNMNQGFILHQFMDPIFSVIFVDPIALMFKYYKYMETTSISEEEKSHDDFLKTYVLQFLFDDLEDIWLLNQIELCAHLIDQFDEDEDTSEAIELPIYSNQFGRLSSSYGPAMREMYLKLSLIRKNQIRVQDLLASRVFEHGSLMDRINDALQIHDIAHRARFDYLRFLRDLPLVLFLVKLYKWKADTGSYTTIAKDLRRTVQRLITRKIWSSVSDRAVATFIELKLNEINELLR